MMLHIVETIFCVTIWKYCLGFFFQMAMGKLGWHSQVLLLGDINLLLLARKKREGWRNKVRHHERRWTYVFEHMSR